jgi:hypothetical protein
MRRQVEQLRLAMAQFNPPPVGQLTLSEDVSDSLQPVIAEAWQSGGQA